VRSAPPGQAFVSVYSLDLDLRSNAPAVRSAEKERNEERWHGTRVSVLIRGAWATYGARIVKYLRQLAVITPYAAITFRYTSEAGGRSDVAMRFARRTGHMPPPPQETMHHPAAGAMRCAGMAVQHARGACADISGLCALLCVSRSDDHQSADGAHQHQDAAQFPVPRCAAMPLRCCICCDPLWFC
jgi:hypothetical protein